MINPMINAASVGSTKIGQYFLMAFSTVYPPLWEFTPSGQAAPLSGARPARAAFVGEKRGCRIASGSPGKAYAVLFRVR